MVLWRRLLSSVYACVCVYSLFFGAEWQSSVVLYSKVFAVDPCAATEEYMCSAGVAHLPPLTEEEAMQSNKESKSLPIRCTTPGPYFRKNMNRSRVQH